MVIEKVHGLQSTSVSLNERFTMLATTTPAPVQPRQRRRQTIGSFLNQSLNIKNRYLIEQIARRLEQQSKRRTLRQRLGVPPGALRRFGSESSLPGLRRFNSFGNLSQSQSVKNRIAPRQFNGNMRRSASFTNLSSGSFRGRNMRGFRRRGGNRNLRGRGRGRGQGRVARRVPFRRGVQGVQGARGAAQVATLRPARGGARGRARGRGGRGGITRNQPTKPVPTKEELDAQLDQYMAGTKTALDKELEAYMKNAGELE